MKKVFLFSILLIISINGNAQRYLSSTVIDKAEFYLKSAVGSELFIHFKLDPDSYYEYKTVIGKTKWENINQNKWTKGNFVNGKNIRFTLDHPDFPDKYPIGSIYVELDSELNLGKEIDLSRIPDFILQNKPSNWIDTLQLDILIARQFQKNSIEKPIRYLEFDAKNREYFWVVINTFYREECFSDVEYLRLDPKSGNVIKHYETRLLTLHCF